MTSVMATVLELWRWPVKGMGGESLPSLRVDARGVGGDRTHTVLGRDADGGWIALSERQEPRLAAWRATYPFNVGANVDPASPPLTMATSPKGRSFMWNDPRLRHALEDDLGRPVQLLRDIAGLQLVERTVLLCWGDDDPQALRANVRLDAAMEEPGRLLESGGAVRLRVLSPCERGGVYARVLGNGRLAVGADLH
jgi:MOSC N-terminal beta barrel domain